MNGDRTRFYRDKINGKIFGVCAGIADYTGVDVLWVRIAAVLLTFSTGFGIPLYIILAMIADKKPQHLYTDRNEQKFWQGVRQSPTRTARRSRSR